MLSVRTARLLIWLLILLPVALVGLTVLRYAVNLPHWDDYMVQEHLLSISNEGSVRHKVARFFDQHWEHRIVWTRTVFYACRKLFGQLNYFWLTLFGVSGLLAMLAVFYAAFRRLALPLAYFIPVSFWLFCLQSHENLLWAMASIQNFHVLVFALVTFYALALNSLNGRRLATVLAVLAAFTSGNGFVVAFSGLLVLLRQRNWRWSAVWALVIVGCLVGYFYNYQRTTFFPSPFRYPYLDWLKAVFVFLGGFADPFPYSGNRAVGYQNPFWLIMPLGALVLFGSAYLLLRSELARQRSGRAATTFWPDFFLGIVAFVMATTFMTVYARVGFGGPGYLLQGRYKIYSGLMLSALYLFSLYASQRGWWLGTARSDARSGKRVVYSIRRAYVVGVMLTTIGWSLFSNYLCLEGIFNQHRRTLADYFNEVYQRTPEQQRALRVVFTPRHKLFYEPDLARLTDSANWTAPATTSLTSFVEQPHMYNITKFDAVNPTLDRPDEGSYILVTNPQRSFLFKTRPMRPSPTALSGFAHYFTPDRFFAQVLKENLKPGRYRIGIYVYQAGRGRLAMTDQYITFTSY